jgi:hypothetical protein
MHISIPHKETREQALAKVKAALDHARPELGGKATVTEERWEGDTLHFAFSAQGQDISGTFEVADTTYVLDVTLPLMLRMFEGKIKSMIESQAQQMLG